MPVYLLDDKVVLSGGEVAISEDCCCAPTGACCVDTNCTIESESDCTGMGGTYQGDDTTCDPNPCEEITGACCHIDGACTIETEEDCDGAYQGDGTACEDVDCAHTGACCVDSNCTITRADDCAGVYQGDGTDCDPNPCPMPTCHECAFLNPDDGMYYLTRTLHVTADLTFLSPTRIWHYDTEKTETCGEGGITCEGFGTGTYDCAECAGGMGCHCDETFYCDPPIVAFGFWSASGMTFTETCDPSDPDICGSGLPTCDFGGCVITSFYTYADPCIPT